MGEWRRGIGRGRAWSAPGAGHYLRQRRWLPGGWVLPLLAADTSNASAVRGLCAGWRGEGTAGGERAEPQTCPQ